MAVTDNDRVRAEAGNGVKVAFDFAFKIFAKTDIKAWKVSAAGVYTLGVVDVDYTVDFSTEAETGTVTWTVAPVSGGFSVIAGSELPVTQATAFPREGVTPAATSKNAFDKLTVLAQQAVLTLSRAVLQPETPVDPDTVILETPEDEKGLMYRDNGDGTISIIPTDSNPNDAPDAAAAAAAAEASQTAAAASQTAAATSATAAATSATAAATSAAAMPFRDVVFLTSADSPRTIAASERGKLFACDCTGGAITVNLPTISGLDLSAPCVIAVKKTDAGANAVTINRGGASDTIDGAATKTLSTQNAAVVLVPDTDPAPDTWTSFEFSTVADGAVTAAKLGVLTTKGDLLAHTGAVHARLAVGTNGQALVADSTQTNGVKWATPAGTDTTARLMALLF